MQQSFSKFMDALFASPDVTGLHSALSHISVAIGFPLFAYLSISGNRGVNPALISNYPTAWTRRYFDLHYDRIDPVILNARLLGGPFLWGRGLDGTALHASQQAFFEEASAFGIAAGFTIPLAVVASRFAAATFASDKNATSLGKLVEAHASALHLISLLFHKKAEAVIFGDRQIAGVKLTRREYECLSWAAQGKSTWDTSKIIGISARTVAYHADNARAKLGVRTTAQAVALLARNRRDESV